LAASYAEEGLFSRASSTEAQALELAIAQSNKPLSAAIRVHQASFSKQKAFHEDRASVVTDQARSSRPPSM